MQPTRSAAIVAAATVLAAVASPPGLAHQTPSGAGQTTAAPAAPSLPHFCGSCGHGAHGGAAASPTGPGTSNFVTSNRWPGALGDPIELTWSIMPDGQGSNLFAMLDADFGSRAAWMPRFEEAVDRFSALTGVTLTRIRFDGDADDGSPWGTDGIPGRVGDIRFRAGSLPEPILGRAISPPPSVGAGDITLSNNRAYVSNWANPFPGFQLIFENTIMHELGHALGLEHVCPVNFTKLMEPMAGAAFYGPQHDDVRALHSLYGDYMEPNDDRLTSPLVYIPIGTNNFDVGGIPPAPGFFGPVNTGRLSIDAPGDVDYFRLQYDEPVRIQVVADAVGTLYDDDPANCGPNGDECCTPGPRTNSATIADLQVEVLDRAGNVLTSSPAIVYRHLSAVGVPYFIRVSSPSTGFTEPQTYSLRINVHPGAPCTSGTFPCDDGIFANGQETCAPSGGCTVEYLTGDCNGNFIEDQVDIASGTSQDCNGNGVPDECEPDCNGNGIADDCDINLWQTSLDINGDGIPDECQGDCNQNMIPDELELSASTDQNSNGVLDECETTRYVPVSATLSPSYPTIQAALDASNPGDTIQLAPGVHGGPGNRNLEIVDMTIQIVGESPFTTTVDLEDQGRFAIIADLDPDPMRVWIEGIRFLDGNANVGDLPFSGDGGAIVIYNTESHILRSIFESNEAAGIGGALYVDRTDPFQSLRNCWFFDNMAGFGAAIATDGQSSYSVLNCTIVDNVATGSAGALVALNHGISVDSSIIRANSSPDGVQISMDLSTSLVRYSDLPNAEIGTWSATPHVGNINENVRFVSRPVDNYRLRGNSPCRNAGNPLLQSIHPDIDGAQRVQEGRVDMGAHEVTTGTPGIGVIITPVGPQRPAPGAKATTPG